ncbi:MAG TPA: RNA methyltransferase [Alphaproteobacteria bacterium]|nr:RNA methyltransferase [Alphaproteobacteria bacterium]
MSDGGMRGYFGVGVERVSKAMNVGNLFRTANGFGASFLFTIDAAYSRAESRSDTSRAGDQIPLYRYRTPQELSLPKGCSLIGVEITEDAVDLPSFRHPLRAAYVMGGERTSLSPELLEHCEHVVRIPARFSLNVATAGAIVMYDRMISLGRFAERPVTPHGKTTPLKDHVHGGPVFRTSRER